MTVPTYDHFIEPVFRYLARHPAGVAARQVHEGAAAALGLSDEDRLQTVPTGQPLYNNRAGWAHDRLKRAGLSSSPKRGIWCLTEAGRKLAAESTAPLTRMQIQEIARGFLDVRLRTGATDEDLPPPLQPVPSPDTQSPDDRLQEALAEIRAAVAADLLDLLGQVSPKYFETVVLDVLHKLGYGASRRDLQRVGGSGDAGIDGVISLDRLGLEKVYVQAKRWQGSVGRPEIQSFYGALAGQRANKGVFITTSTYTQQAVEFARSVERIVLIDGMRLAGFMMDCQVGVSIQQIGIPKIDSDYFDE
ncbi:MAG: restriction endonuclease [Xanthomonadales bacterium]|nr:restriction endonuclease [Xanthomonadales bacterium]